MDLSRLKSRQVLCGPKAMRFIFFEEHWANFAAKRPSDIVGASTGGLQNVRIYHIDRASQYCIHDDDPASTRIQSVHERQ
tara:strand:+ start:102 stop:341 length:240 start_codon:yes stop_codon:yes gene_type:complete